MALALVSACATQSPAITKLVRGRQITTRGVAPDAYEHAARAMLFEEEERWQDAAAELGEALDFDGDSPELHARRAEVLLRFDHVKDAAAEAHASLSLAATAEGFVALAHVQRSQGDAKAELEALGQASKLVDFQADDDEAELVYLELAQTELVALDLDAARATLTTLCTAEPGSGTGRMHLAAIAWALHDMAGAEAQLQGALAEEPNQIEALTELAWIYAATGRDGEARATFRDALDRSEGELDLAAAFARYLVGLGAVKEAEQVADDLAVPASSLAADSLAARVELERSARRFQHGLDLLAEATRMGIGDTATSRITLLRSALLHDLGKPEAALAELLKLGKDSPLFFEARLRAAELLHEAGKCDQAIRLVDEAAAGQSPALASDAVVSAALLEEECGKASAAVARLGRALAQHPDEGKLVLTLAAIEERQGGWSAALDRAEKFLAKNPGSVEALNFWGFIAADHDHALDLALRRVQAANALDPGSGGLLDSLGWAHFHRHQVDQAGLFLEQAARLEPADPEIEWHLGTVYAARKETERARSAFHRALGGKPDQRLRLRVEESLGRLNASPATHGAAGGASVGTAGGTARGTAAGTDQ